MLLEIENLYGGYGKEDIVKGITAHADAGEILCLVGPNGCGKTTLFRLILGALKATSGKVLIDGKDTSQLSQKELAKLVAYIPQYHTPIYEYTVLEIVLMGRVSHFSAFDQPSAADREAAFSALEKINAAHLANEKYTDLSGGQRQLILIARAICQEAKIFVMDEPAANLDYANHQLLMDVIVDLAQKGYLVVMSTHSPEHPASIGSKVLMMKSGKVASFGPPEKVITSQNLENVYGVEMDVVTFSDRYGVKRTICFPVKKPKNKKIHALIVGSIGVGKSTFAKACVGMHRYEGKIKGNDSAILIGSGSNVPAEFSIADIVKLLKKRFESVRVDNLFELLKLSQVPGNLAIKKMSDGQKQKIKLLAFLSANPKVIILDEFT